MRQQKPPTCLQAPIPIAVCLAGFSPAVVTETLYALAVQRRPPIIPQRVLILTTEDACGRIMEKLPGKKGAIRRLVAEYGLPENSMICNSSDVIVLRSRSGKPLEDIRSSEDSREAGEAIAGILHQLHADPQVQLHCSLAGGRKTMGVLLALALQLCARPGDSLYHVLVNEPFEKIEEFFYPPRKPRHYLLDGKRVDSRRARIDLAEIPFVRLGAVAQSMGFDGEDLARRAEAIEMALSEKIYQPRLILEFSARRVRIDDIEIRLPPQEFALYALYASLRSECRPCTRRRLTGCKACRVTDGEIFDLHREQLLSFYNECSSASGSRLVTWLSDRSGSGNIRMAFDDWLRQTRSRVNSILRRSGSLKVGPCLISLWSKQNRNAGSEKRRGLSLLPEHIAILNVGRKKINVEK